MIIFVNLQFLFTFIIAKAVDTNIDNSSVILRETRRILRGHEVGDTRPYMVYLRPAASADTKTTDPDWLCGGVIIHERYVLTSAACIEDVKQFYVVSGTHRLISTTDKNDECIKNGAKKAVWKCVPKTYYFDGNDFDNIRWMINDIAVVKVEDDFNFERRIRGCDFIPKMIAYNNETEESEKPGTVGSIAGWGSTDHFGSVPSRAALNSPVLLEADVVLLSKKNCKKRWETRYHYIIENNMICAKDGLDTEIMSSACSEHEVNCKDLVYSDENEDATRIRRQMSDPKQMLVHTADHTRRNKVVSGGFCENDHGGPLVVGQGKSATVIGVISACMTKDLTHKCYGPFLYTSVYRNRNLINCAINKDIGATCRGIWRSTKSEISETVYNWAKHPDGPAKSELHRRSYFDLQPHFREHLTTTESHREPSPPNGAWTTTKKTTTTKPTTTTKRKTTTTKPMTTTTKRKTTTTTKRQTTTTKRKTTTTTKRKTTTTKRKTTTTKHKTTKSKHKTTKNKHKTTKKGKHKTTKKAKHKTTKKAKPTTKRTTRSTTTTTTTTTTTEKWPRLRDMLYMLKTDFE